MTPSTPSAPSATRNKRDHLRVGDPQEVPEEQRVDPVQIAPVEAHEEKSQGEQKRLHRPGHGVLLTERPARANAATVEINTAAATQKVK